MAEPVRQQLIFFFLLGSAGILSMAVGVVYFFFLYQKKLIKEESKMKKLEEQYHVELVNAIIKSQEIERKKIADNVHDNLSAHLYAIRLSLSQMMDSLTQEERAKYGERMLMNCEMLQETIDTTKKIARELVPVSLGITGISGALKDYCGRLNSSGISINFVESGFSLGLKQDVKLHLFRIAQELISNSIKHSAARKIVLEFKWEPSSLIAKFTDDGVGCIYPSEPNKSPMGMGVLNIMGRLELIKGVILNHGNADVGFCFIFKVPNEQ